MQRLILTLLSLFCLQVVPAKHYKILYLNSQQIKINDAYAKVGDSFDDKTVIKWSVDRQAMKVVEAETNKRYLMVAKLSEGRELTVYDILTKNKHLSTHEGENTQDKYLKLEMTIADEYNLLDSIEISTELLVDDKHYFLGSYRYGDTILTKKLNTYGNIIVIDKSLFYVDENLTSFLRMCLH